MIQVTKSYSATLIAISAFGKAKLNPNSFFFELTVCVSADRTELTWELWKRSTVNILEGLSVVNCPDHTTDTSFI